jgi:hypothetical protein
MAVVDNRPLPYAVTVACSSTLLFVVQPVMAKAMLPRFGGSAGVWVTSMLFFQVVLLLGYLYSYWLTRFPSARARTFIHLALLASSLVAMPLRPAAPVSIAHPTTAILLILARSVGLPFFVLSTAGPLVQSWYAGSTKGRFPFRLFALSNLACLVALLAYPVAVEPALVLQRQMAWWSAGYGILVVLLVVGTIANRAWHDVDQPLPAPNTSPWLWIGLSACASTLWLAIANYLSQEVAAIPFLWILPLGLYLLSFVLCFEWEGWYQPRISRWALPVAWIAIAYRIGAAGASRDPRLDIPILLTALFIVCIFCHGELARRKPAAGETPAFFYLTVAAGGAFGGIFVALLAPALFATYLELPIGVVASVFLALALLYGLRSGPRLARLGIVAAAAFIIAARFHGGAAHVSRERNFYGTLQISDSGEGERTIRTLYNGRTIHGAQFLASRLRRLPTTYYGQDSGIGVALQSSRVPNRRIAVIGLGAGTLAAYARTTDTIRFYEVNPAVIRAARTWFHFLEDARGTIEIVEGDGRLCLSQEAARSFDTIILDAFSDDAVPVHLLTREAFEVYFTRLRPGGNLLIHLTNRYLDLTSVVEAQAAAIGKTVAQVHSAGYSELQTLPADWAAVFDGAAQPQLRPVRPWTDEFSNLLQAWK